MMSDYLLDYYINIMKGDFHDFVLSQGWLKFIIFTRMGNGIGLETPILNHIQ